MLVSLKGTLDGSKDGCDDEKIVIPVPEIEFGRSCVYQYMILLRSEEWDYLIDSEVQSDIYRVL
jgi:hypothetical protein